VMLLQTRQKLVDGETFTCAVVFQKAGTKETEVQVSRKSRLHPLEVRVPIGLTPSRCLRRWALESAAA
jgi:hypothetical protein